MNDAKTVLEKWKPNRGDDFCGPKVVWADAACELYDALAASEARVEALEVGLVAALHVYVEVINGRQPDPVDFEVFTTVANDAKHSRIEAAIEAARAAGEVKP
jgi:hypothetical protein